MKSLDPLIQGIISNPILCLIIWLVTILGFIFTFILYRKNRKVKGLTVSYKSINLIRDFTSRLSKLIVAYEDRQVENVTVIKIAIWNSGNVTIDKQDITQKDPLRITISEGCDLLDTETIYCTNKAINFKHILKDERIILIEFDYLDHDQGGIIQLIHTGTDPGPINVCGSVKGVGKLKFIGQRYLREEINTWEIGGLVGFFAAGAFFLFLSAVGPFTWATFLLGLLYILVSGVYGYSLFRRRIPKDLKILTESFEPKLSKK